MILYMINRQYILNRLTLFILSTNFYILIRNTSWTNKYYFSYQQTFIYW